MGKSKAKHYIQSNSKGLKGTAKEKIEQQLLKERSFGKEGVEKELDREGSYTDLTDAAKSKAAFFDIIGSANDNDDLQIFLDAVNLEVLNSRKEIL